MHKKEAEEQSKEWTELSESLKLSLESTVKQYDTCSTELTNELARVKQEKELRDEKFNSLLSQTKRVYEKQLTLIKEREVITFEQIENWENRFDKYKTEQDRLVAQLKNEVQIIRGSG